ncbi:RhuM family protein [Parabacteroides gordonii]|uniref:RhuM family protein n=1 Tax=Parabacteroides gordonii TaxID=574930 RepID=UPI0026F1BC28|nr:RhuM family protein [Parabacteroides gordonii]
MDENNKNNEVLIYRSQDGAIKVDVLFEGETVWLTIEQMSTLFGKSRSTINEHILNIYKEKELSEDDSMRKIGISDFSTKPTNYYNLDVIISVGYRVKSQQGTQFRIWATQRLRDYIIKGFALNDERFKTGSSMNYFRELLERIREIRLSERVFYQQIKDIYATSIDYDPTDEMTLSFYKEIQNKLLWAVSGKTAAELIYYRANATLPMMGLTSTSHPDKVVKADITVGKNYLNEEEISMLKLIVEQFLAFAEAQAMAHKPLYMRDWIEKLKLVLTMNEKSILEDAGHISHQLAVQKAGQEYTQYKEVQRAVERLNSIKELDEDIKRLKGKKTDTGRKNG